MENYIFSFGFESLSLFLPLNGCQVSMITVSTLGLESTLSLGKQRFPVSESERGSSVAETSLSGYITGKVDDYLRSFSPDLSTLCGSK